MGFGHLYRRSCAHRRHRRDEVIPRAGRPVAEGVHALLDGTALFRFTSVVDVISRTGIGPRDAALLLRGGGTMLVDFLNSEHTYFSTRSRALLTQLRGRDLGARAKVWRAWIDTL